MNYLTLEKVTKTYGDKVLFRDIDLHISRGDKVALVAQNGTGKTTLLRLVAGEEKGEGEQCKVLMARDIRVGYLRQEPNFPDDWTVMEAIFESENPMIRAIRQYEEALLYPEKAKNMQAALTKMEDLKAWDFESKIKEILFKLNITELNKEIGLLSGGQQKRLALAKLLIDEPEFIILDEPTNHLDLDMIEWLEEYIRQANLTIFMVTHDRYFLERVCTMIVELDKESLYKYHGNYSEFLEKKATRFDNESVEVEKAQKLMRKELEWIRKMPKARGTKAKSRVDAFDRIKEKASNKVEKQEVQIEIKGARLGSKILEINYINKQYDDNVLIKDFFYKFKKNERVGIVGKNGVGKSTFLKLITKEIRPDSGTIVIGGTVKFGYYTQDGIQLKSDKRVIEVITDIAEYIPLEKGLKLSASQLLDRFLFNKKHQQVFVSQLSGGERRRLYLLTVLMENPNFLILDEPTNDLDILTLNVLENFLLEFPGCVLIVSHDRFFMDKLVDHLFIFEGEGVIKDYNGNYTDYRANKKIEDRQQEKAPKEKKERVRSDDDKPKLSYLDRKEFNRLEKEIEKLEERKTEITGKFNDPNLSSEDIQKLSVELGQISQSIDEKEMRWLELSEFA
ncbi:MAG: ATP-binding cassette subfamily F protein uup [Saprospiraceae bacterium]